MLQEGRQEPQPTAGSGWAWPANDPKASVFYAFGTPGEWTTCYYQYGLDEDDALSRLAKSVKNT